MKRTVYLLKDMSGEVRAQLVNPEGEDVLLAPWMVYNIQHRGWRLESWETTAPGVAVHGWVDWKAVADELATVLMVITEDGREPDEEADERLLAQAQSALDSYHVALMEVSVAEVDASGEDGDGKA